MKAQIIEKHGKKEFAVIPYKDFLRLQEEVKTIMIFGTCAEPRQTPKIDRGDHWISLPQH